MISYGFGFDPNEYEAMLALQIELKKFGRNCKALIKRVGHRVQQKKK